MAASVATTDYPGHTVLRPRDWTSPYLLASPHAGRTYPGRFLDASRLTLLELRRSEDAYVDALLPEPDALGVPILRADFPRAFVDVNRAPYELDPLLFDAPVAADTARSGRVLAGFGVVPKLAAEGRAIYARRLPASEARARIRMCYHPYHASLRGLITECLTRFGEATLIDFHSMPSAGAGRSLPSIVLGDRFGASCAPGLMRRWELAFRTQGFSTARNTPYAGGYVTSLYGRPVEGVHVIQVETNRGLYLDERQVARSQGFAATKAALGRVLDGAVRMPAASLAAE